MAPTSHKTKHDLRSSVAELQVELEPKLVEKFGTLVAILMAMNSKGRYGSKCTDRADQLKTIHDCFLRFVEFIHSQQVQTLGNDIGTPSIPLLLNFERS